MVRARIVGAGHYLPENVITNSQFTQEPVYRYISDTEKAEPRLLTEQGIVETTGIVERRCMGPEEDAPHLGMKAAEMALRNAGINASQLEVIVVATESYKRFPSTAATIQSRLSGANAACYDVGVACAGFPIAVQDVMSRLSRGAYGLAVSASGLSRKATRDDINRTLFGDGAGAVVIYREQDDDSISFHLPERGVWLFRPGDSTESGIYAIYHRTITSDGRIDLIYETPDGCIRMPNGKAVFSEAVNGMVEATVALKRHLGWAEADKYSPHQANKRIIDKYFRKLEIPEGKIFVNVHRYGNMSAATSSVALSEMINSGEVKKGDKVILPSVGAGLNVSCVALIV